jgi:hypothetical protein
LDINPVLVARGPVEYIFVLLEGTQRKIDEAVRNRLTSVTREGRAMFHWSKRLIEIEHPQSQSRLDGKHTLYAENSKMSAQDLGIVISDQQGIEDQMFG